MTDKNEIEVERITKAELVALINEAAENGAAKVLYKVGLHDEHAGKDIQDLRQLLSSWRETRRTIWTSIVKWATVGTLAYISALLYMKFNAE